MALASLPGEVVLHCLGFLDPSSLCALSACSRHLWALAQDDALWRALVERERAPGQRQSLGEDCLPRSYRTWKAVYQEECARAPRAGFVVVSQQELVMAELNPWRMTNIVVTPLNGRRITKNNRNRHLRVELLHNLHVKTHHLINQRWFVGEHVEAGSPRVQVLVVGVLENMRILFENFPVLPFAAECLVLEPVVLQYAGNRGLRSLLRHYMVEQAPATPFHRSFEVTARFFTLLRDDPSLQTQQQRCVTFPELGLALRQGKLTKIETLLISEELLDHWLVLCSSHATDDEGRYEDWSMLEVVPRDVGTTHSGLPEINWPQMHDWANGVRLRNTKVSWVSSCFDMGRVFGQTFGIAGVLSDGSCCRWAAMQE